MDLEADVDTGFESLLRDPLIRLVMDSDGVTDEALIALMDQLRCYLTDRNNHTEDTRASRSG